MGKRPRSLVFACREFLKDSLETVLHLRTTYLSLRCSFNFWKHAGSPRHEPEKGLSRGRSAVGVLSGVSAVALVSFILTFLVQPLPL